MKEKMAKVKAWMKENWELATAGAVAIGGAVGSVIFMKKSNEAAVKAKACTDVLTILSKIGVQALKDDKYSEEELEEILKD